MTLLDTFAAIAGPRELLHSRYMSEETRSFWNDFVTTCALRKRLGQAKSEAGKKAHSTRIRNSAERARGMFG